MVRRGIGIFIIFCMFCTMNAFAVWNEELKEPLTVNLVRNGGFEQVSDDGIYAMDWNLDSGTRWMDGRLSIDSTDPYSGENCIKMVKNEKDAGAALLSQLICTDFIEGAKYQIRAMVKSSDIKAQGLYFKVDFFDPAEYTVAASTGFYLYTDKTGDTNNEWTQYAATFTAPTSAPSMALLPLFYSAGTFFIDDVALYMVGEPDKGKLVTDEIFYYSDRTEDCHASFKLDERYPEYSGCSVKYTLTDVDKVIAEQECEFDGLNAVWDFPMQLLSEKKKKYVVTAALLDKNGTKTETHTQNVYKYDRPSMLNEKGQLIVDGKVFIPVQMTGIKRDNYKEAMPHLAEAGINTVGYVASWLDDCLEMGMKAIVYLYPNMKAAGHPDNIEWTRQVLEKYHDHPAVLAWNVLDEPFLNTASEKDLEESYKLIREYDDVHPIYLNEAPNKRDIDKCVKYADIVGTDPYPIPPHNPAQFIYEMMAYTAEASNHHKPLFAVLQAFEWQKYYPEPHELRSGIYQALWAGSKWLAYYYETTAYTNENKPVFVWDTDLWQGAIGFNNLEKEGAFGHFITKKYPPFSDYRGSDSWYRGYVKDGELYMIVLNTGNTDKQVSIPLTSYNSAISIKGFTAESVIGSDEGTRSFDGNVLTSDVQGNGVVLYKIKPKSKVDFSSLSWDEFKTWEKAETEKLADISDSSFDDLSGVGWAANEINDLYKKGIIGAQKKYLPEQKITRGDFAMYLMNALGLVNTGDDNFADINENDYYASQIKAGKALGIFNGDEKGNFNPSEFITRQDALAMCYRGMLTANKVKESEGSGKIQNYEDFGMISGYALDAFESMVDNGIIVGDAKNMLNPKGYTTRAEAAVIIHRIMEAPVLTESAPEVEKTPANAEEKEISLPPDTATEEQKANRIKAADFLAMLKIINGTTFDSNAPLTRGEAAKYAAKLFNYSGSAADLKFNDIEGNENAQYINFAKSLDLVSGFGDGSFRPGEPITCNQFIKVLISALGYDIYAENEGGFPVGYLTEASKTGLTDGALVTGDNFIRAGDGAVLLMNVLQIPLVSATTYGAGSAETYGKNEDDTFLSLYHDVNVYEKVKVTGTYLTSLDGSKVKKDEISISGGKVFKTGKTNAESYIGQKVTIYAASGGDTEAILIIKPSGAEVKAVDAGRVLKNKTVAQRLYYENDEHEEFTCNMDSSTVIVLNNQVTGKKINEVIPDSGVIKLISNNGAGADVVIVSDFSTHVVDSVSASNCTIYFKDGTSLVLDESDTGERFTLKTTAGKEIKLDSLSERNVLSVAKSVDKTRYEVICSTQKVSGKISEMGIGSITIEGVEYDLAESISASELSYRNTGTYYLDFMGRIAAADTDAGTSRYGYLINMGQKKGVEKIVQLRLLTEDNKITVFDVNETITLNGNSAAGESLFANPLLYSGTKAVEQVISYTVNESNVITAIDTAQQGENMDDTARKTSFTLDYQTDSNGVYFFSSGDYRLFADRFILTENTKVFRIVDTAENDNKKYSVDAEPLRAFKSSTTYRNLQFFDCDDNKISCMITRDVGAVAFSGADYQYGIGGVITDITSTVNEDGEKMTNVYVYNHEGNELALSTSDPEFEVILGERCITDLGTEKCRDSGGNVSVVISLNDLKKGDVVLYVLNSLGELDLMKVLYRAQSPVLLEDSQTWGVDIGRNYAPLTFGYGTVKGKTDLGLRIMMRLSRTIPIEYERFYYYKQQNTSTQYYLFDNEKKKLSVINADDIIAGDKIFVMKQTVQPRLMIVYR